MGQDFYEEFHYVRELFEMAEETTKLPLKKLCFEGPLEALTETVNLQPAVTTVNLAILAAIEKEGIAASIAAGHSLGEYSALSGSGALSKEQAISLVLDRGRLMHREAEKHKGAMAAVVGLTIDQVESLVAEASSAGTIAVANHNAETQVAVTGSPDPVSIVAEKAAALGARAVPLKVSGAWHSELIKGAEEEFNAILTAVSFQAPNIPIVLNVTAEILTDPARIQETMGRQLCSPVKWFDTMGVLMSEEIDTFLEIGPGSVLTGLLKKTLPRDYPRQTYTINTMKRFEKCHRNLT